ncbi:MAG: hypothetical protein R3C00_10385 [Hyphomonas sp.]
MTGTRQYGVAQQAAQTDATAIVAQISLKLPIPALTHRQQISGAQMAGYWASSEGRFDRHRPIPGYQRADFPEFVGPTSCRGAPASVGAVGSRQLVTLAAALADFVDDDDVRRPQGGERAGYRLRQHAIQPIHQSATPAELPAVLGWDRLGFSLKSAFVESVTLSFTSPEPLGIQSERKASSVAAQSVPPASSRIDVLARANASFSSVPGAHARFTLTATDRASGRCLIRIVGDRTPGGLCRSAVFTVARFRKGGACSAATTPLAQPLWTNLLGDQSDGT